MSTTSAPPPYYKTIYDETFRYVRYEDPSISSMGNRPNLAGQLEYHAPTTDGSFSICLAEGMGVFISKELLDSIPAEHRPALDTTHAGEPVGTLFGGASLRSIGTTLFPIILRNTDTNEKFRIVLHVIVLPKLLIPMFFGASSGNLIRSRAYTAEGVFFEFQFNDEIVRVQGF